MGKVLILKLDFGVRVLNPYCQDIGRIRIGKEGKT
jgi:hypothetical protein